ncbi:hypothetical protein SAMN04487950_3817 [Halogranum rubrum]|uniref:Uncharacterized protein n=1 Tax=Halogranum rubrum TaxID=553466 RepID=A0A1I4HSL9_9EURY|nr:hypothetical protein SAMN04487950_3817 [Halogranum rubrum]
MLIVDFPLNRGIAGIPATLLVTGQKPKSEKEDGSELPIAQLSGGCDDVGETVELG